MRRLLLPNLLLLFLTGCLAAQSEDFRREGNAKQRALKDPLENRLPPALEVKGWLNNGGKDLKLEDLKGKVVVLDFWGVW